MMVDAPVRAWIERNLQQQLRFGAGAALPDGFGWLLDDGSVDAGRPQATWLTARLTHVYSLATLLERAGISGVAGADALAQRGIDALRGPLRDGTHGGWFSTATSDGPVDDRKESTVLAQVLLAAATASVAGVPGASMVLDEAADLWRTRCWDDAAEMPTLEWRRDWTGASPQRTATSCMHGLEAMLAVADIDRPGIDSAWFRSRALGVADRLIHRAARANAWRLPQAYDADWNPELERNAEHPADPFNPYGAPIGLAFEWVRLLIALQHSLGADAPDWLLPAARSLYAVAKRDGWSASGPPGFVMSTDWQGVPIVRQRLHWVHTEAISAAAALADATGDAGYAEDFAVWWHCTRDAFVDQADGPALGSWRHELDPENRPATTIWSGRPDLYHSVQAEVFSLIPMRSSPHRSVLLAADGVQHGG